MDVTGAVIGVVQAAGGTLYGRTTLQKLVYFAAFKGLISARFRPHYYGPYSEEVASAVDALSANGFLSEETKLLGPQMDPWLLDVAGNAKAYAYSLPPDGESLAQQVKRESPREWREIEKLVGMCREHAKLSPGILATAAKVHYILSQGTRSMDEAEITRTATEFGWKLTEGQIIQVARLLRELGLVR